MTEDVARRTLLPVNEVEMWLNHLRTIENNRKRGAAKAAETRRQKRELALQSKQQTDNVYHWCVGVFMRRKPMKLNSGLAVNIVIHGFMLPV